MPTNMNWDIKCARCGTVLCYMSSDDSEDTEVTSFMQPFHCMNDSIAESDDLGETSTTSERAQYPLCDECYGLYFTDFLSSGDYKTYEAPEED